jgi:ABC-type nickel/cobalt efflux system permease component RcnA
LASAIWHGDWQGLSMQYYTLLAFGCLVGMQHALEADHLAAVAALSKSGSSRRALVLRGSAWGLGHTVTLLTVCCILWVLGESISPHAEALLEFIVGAMIVLLGVNVLYTIWRRRPHIHVHRHADGVRHVHIHTHADDSVQHAASTHQHSHERVGLPRAVVVGMVHGVAGSAGLMVLAAAAGSITEALGYVLAFGIGSIAGMAALSLVASYPLRWLERGNNWVNTTVFISIGGAAILVGTHLMGQSWSHL